MITQHINYSTAILSADKGVLCALLDYNPQSGSRDKQKPFKYDPKTLGELKKGDIVVVPTEDGHRCGFTTCKVVEPNHMLDPDYEKDVTWIVEKVDTEAYKTVVANEEAIIRVFKEARAATKQREMAQFWGIGEQQIAALPDLSTPIKNEE